MTQIVQAVHPYWDSTKGRNKKGGWNEPKLKTEYRRLYMQAVDERRRPLSLSDFATRVNMRHTVIKALYKNYHWYDEIKEHRTTRIAKNEQDFQEQLQDQKLRIIKINARTLRHAELNLHRARKRGKDGQFPKQKPPTPQELLTTTRTIKEIHTMTQLELHEPTNVTHNREVKIIMKLEAPPYETRNDKTGDGPRTFTVAVGGSPSTGKVQGSGRGEENQEDRPGSEIPPSETPSVAGGERGLVSSPGEEAGEKQRVEESKESLPIPEPLAVGGETERERPDDSDSGESPDENGRVQRPGDSER